LFDGGRRAAAVRGANAQYDGYVADYRQTVLTAFQQVEDNLAALHTLQDESDSQQRAADAANQALQLILNRYKAGAVGYLDVVTAQSMALTQERAVDEVARRRMDASVMLLRALGGGWHDTALDAPMDKPAK
jgi:outer membrane protein TolC